MTPKNILITGASGLIGTRLTEMLVREGHAVSHLSRNKKEGPVPTYEWDVHQRLLSPEAFRSTDTIVHLAGAGIADEPWTKKRKQEILESRTRSTRLLFEELKKDKRKVTCFVSASAIGYYGLTHAEKFLSESDPPGTDFLATVVKQWEEEVEQIASLGIRVVRIRIGIVLSDEGGVLKEMMRPIKYWVGSPLGSGDQYLSWIHLHDLCRIFSQACTNESMNGVYNAVSPSPITNRELTKSVARALHKPIILPPVPEFVLKFLFGEMADLILYGSQVSSKKIEDTGFQFKFTVIDDAVTDLVGKRK